jgi:hypothetical protein
MTNSQDIRSQKDTDSGSNAISLLNELNQVSTAIDALRSLDLPPFLDSSSIDSFNKAKKDTYLTWFATVLDEAALASILIVKDLYNLDIRNAATILEDTVKLPSAMTAFKAALAKLNTVEVALLAAEKAIVVTDKAKLLAFTAKMNQIEAAIQQLSDKIEASAFQIGANIAITYIKVGINVATEESPVMPLVQGVVKVGESIAKDFVMTAEINKLDNELYAIWKTMAEEEQQLATLQASIKQLQGVIAEENVANTIASIETLWTAFQADIQSENWDAVGAFINRFDTIETARNSKLYKTK